MANAVRITASEFRQNFGTYMKNVATTDYEVTRNGRVIGLWTDPHRDSMAAFHRLAGSITVPEDFDIDRAKEQSFAAKFPEYLEQDDDAA